MVVVYGLGIDEAKSFLGLTQMLLGCSLLVQLPRANLCGSLNVFHINVVDVWHFLMHLDFEI